MSYKISLEASGDIENIWIYNFENWSLEQANRYINLIFDEIEYLSKNPIAGKSVNYIKKAIGIQRLNLI